MDKIELAVTKRNIAKRAAKRLRQQGLVPAMLYGHGTDNVPLQAPLLDLSRILTKAGSSQLIHLKIGKARSTQPVLAREIQRNVLTGEPIHVDFLAVSMTEKITAQLSLNLVGEPGPVSLGEGILLQGANALEIECLPGDLIPSLDVDVSELEFDSAIYVSDLDLPISITVLSDPQEMVAQVVHERLAEEVEEEEELVEEEAPEVEIVGRGKEEETEE